MRSRTRGAVGAGGENPLATRLDSAQRSESQLPCCYTHHAAAHNDLHLKLEPQRTL